MTPDNDGIRVFVVVAIAELDHLVAPASQVTNVDRVVTKQPTLPLDGNVGAWMGAGHRYIAIAREQTVNVLITRHVS